MNDENVLMWRSAHK